MKIRVQGAAGGEVTGSAYLIQTSRSNVLVDAGMFQGGRQSEAKNKIPKGATPDQIDAILLTHGHLDHTGRVPLLIKYGFDGPIYTTEETIELTQIILQDSARLQVADAIRQNKRAWRKREKGPLAEPLYNSEHVEFMKELTRPVPFHKSILITDDISARWIEAGHMLGSGSIEVTVNENGKNKVIVFSGDLGPLTLPLLRPFEQLTKADLVFLESTYGDRDHKPYDETLEEFKQIVKKAYAEKGKMLVPTFAIGRAQQIIYHLAEMFANKDVPPFPVYMDSPMGLSAFEVYKNHQDLLDEEYQALKKRGVFPLSRRTFVASQSAETSKALNEAKGPCMILAGAGMCNGGRILHHLYRNLENPNAHIIIVGFQSDGSLGRRIVERRPEISIFGDRLKLLAQVHTLGGFSAHAGQTDLLKWFSTLAPAKPKLVITHGENVQRAALAEQIRKKYKITAILPKIGDTIEL
ncbi:MAG: MBL fold metallo-hydrolase [Cyclobacteriaceae bacterium]|nr:MBL fold metallo-hydrolase [Cyclobacteriaceae bacterium]